jgi:hypothetical protein
MQAFGGRPKVDCRGVDDGERSSRRACRRMPLLSLLCVLLLAPAARAAPVSSDRFALVLGEAAYESLPPEPGCAVSAQVIGERLRALGFDLVMRTDASNGEISAALIDLTRRAGSAADPTVVVYFCGHVVAFDGRTFLLPVGAALARPPDALAEGLPAQALIDLAGRNSRVGLTIFDLYDLSSHSGPAIPPAVTSLLADQKLLPGHVVLAAVEKVVTTTATPLAQSLSAALAQPPIELDRLSAAIRKDLTDSGAAFAASGNGGGAALIAALPPAAQPQPAAPKPVTTPTSLAPPATSAAAPTVPAPGLPAEQQYSVLDRRRVQAALRLLGYYNGAVDGVFGPQTRAAIRHYQHDAGEPATGTLTSEEADRLVAGLPQTSR